MISLISTRPLHRGHPRRRAAGSTLAATMMVVAAIMTFLSIAALLTSQYGRFAGRQQGTSAELAAADAALEYAYAQWKVTVTKTIHSSKTNIPPASSWDPTILLANFKAAYTASGTFAGPAGVSCTALSISATDQSGVSISTKKAPVGIDTSNVPDYPGWSGKTYYYMASATVSGADHFGHHSTEGQITVNRFFQVTTVPLFQAAIFYENVLEIHPGAKMVVTGLVHSNDTIYALGYAATLQFMSNVSYVGSFNESSNPAVKLGWDGGNTSATNVPDVYKSYFPNYWADNKPTTTPTNTSIAPSTARAGQIHQVSTIDPFGGAAQSSNGLHDIVEVPVNNNSDQIAYNNASLIIHINSAVTPANNPARIVITDGAGKPLKTTAEENAVRAALSATPPTTITDIREKSTVTVTSLDMALLAKATVPPTSGGATALQNNFAGTVYIHDLVKPGSGTRAAIRLVNGRNLGQNVSIASENGVYIQGDYNTGGSKASDVQSNVDPTKPPEATNYDRYSSSVMADAVTILSNSWNDANSGDTLNGTSTTSNGKTTTTPGRVATATTVNTAILAGDVPSNRTDNGKPNGIASGGAHNFPRFLEDWTNINFTYYGSLVEAFNSEQFTGTWGTGNVYHWPNRLWNFDTVFLQTQPPGVPTGIQFSRGRWQRALN